MNKWIAIPVIAVLAVALIVVGVFLWQQTDKLGEARDDIAALEDNVATLEGNVADLEGDLAATQSELAATRTGLAVTLSDLAATQSDLADTESELATTQSNLVATQSDLADTESELATTQGDLAATQSDLAAALDQVSQLEDFKTGAISTWASLLPKVELAERISYFDALLYGDSPRAESVYEDLSDYVEAVDDTELSELWDECLSEWDYGTFDDWCEAYVEFLDRLVDLLSADIEAMELQLAE